MSFIEMKDGTKKKNVTKLATVKSMIRSMNEIYHDYLIRCDTCLELDKDDELKTIIYSWRTQTENEASLIRDLHLSENEGHSCEVKVG